MTVSGGISANDAGSFGLAEDCRSRYYAPAMLV